MEGQVAAVKSHKIKGLVLEVLNTKDDLKEVDIIVPGPIGTAFLNQLNKFKTEGVPLNLLLGSTSSTASTRVSTTAAVVRSGKKFDYMWYTFLLKLITYYIIIAVTGTQTAVAKQSVMASHTPSIASTSTSEVIKGKYVNMYV